MKIYNDLAEPRRSGLSYACETPQGRQSHPETWEAGPHQAARQFLPDIQRNCSGWLFARRFGQSHSSSGHGGIGAGHSG